MRISDWSSDVCSSDLLDAARRALEPGETLVWADRPDPQALARSRLPQVIRGVLGLAVIATFLWLSFLPNWPGGLRGVLLGVFLAAALLYACWLLAAPLAARRAAGSTVYAVTDRRLILLEGWPTVRQRSEERRDGQECVSTCRSRWEPD